MRKSVPATGLAHALSVVDGALKQIARVAPALDRARSFSLAYRLLKFEAPTDARLANERKKLSKLNKEIKLLTVAIEHPDSDDEDFDEDKARQSLSSLKRNRLEVQRLVEQAALELVGAAADFPELPLRYPKARIDELLESGGDGGVLRSIELYEAREPMKGGRHDLFRATIDGKQVALKRFNIHTQPEQRAFMKEARRLRQLAHPHIVEVIHCSGFLFCFIFKFSN